MAIMICIIATDLAVEELLVFERLEAWVRER